MREEARRYRPTIGVGVGAFMELSSGGAQLLAECARLQVAAHWRLMGSRLRGGGSERRFVANSRLMAV